MKYPMQVLCAWCGCLIRTAQADRPDVISHGICLDCKRKIEAEMKEKP